MEWLSLSLPALSAEDALQILFTCRQARTDMQPFVGALAFAVTRPEVHVNTQPPSLQMWKILWDQCAASVAQHGLDVGAWACAETCTLDYEEAEGMKVHPSFPCNSLELVMTLVKKRGGTPSVSITQDPELGTMVKDELLSLSAVLLVSIESSDDDRVTYGSALAATCAGRFVLMKFISSYYCGLVRAGAIYLANDLSRVLALTHGESSWAVTHEGCLNVVFDKVFDKELVEQSERAWHFVRLGNTPIWLAPSQTRRHKCVNAQSLLRASWQWNRDRVHPDYKFEPLHLNDLSVESRDPNVIQAIMHAEPAAIRDVSLLQLHADEEWAADVETRLHSSRPDYTEGPPEAVQENIILLQYKSHPHEFLEALTEGVPLRACRDALAAAHRHCVLPESGAKAFIKPEQWQVVMSRIQGMELRPYHVIVAEEYEHLVSESLQAIPFRRRPKLKQGCGRVLLQQDESTDAVTRDAFEDSLVDLVPVRSFLCCVPLLRSASSVVQSTAAHYGAIGNPRRYVV